MSEQAKPNTGRHETLRHHEHEANQHHEHEQSHEQATSSEHQPDIEALETHAKVNALRTEQISHGKEHHTEPEPIIGTQRALKADAYKHTLKKVRTHLKPSQKVLSRLIHQPVVESISEATAKSAARPSGLLGGGVVSLLGSGTLLYMSKHFGFRYNFFVFILLFAAGFGAGVILEVLFRGLKKKA